MTKSPPGIGQKIRHATKISINRHDTPNVPAHRTAATAFTRPPAARTLVAFRPPPRTSGSPRRTRRARGRIRGSARLPRAGRPRPRGPLAQAKSTYQHATNDRDRELANDMDKRITSATNPKKPNTSKKKPKPQS
ncbi:hypothetical protein JCM9533A_37310 [Catenuloplanes niger JCM 9533]